MTPATAYMTLDIPDHLTPALVDANPQLKRNQQDLLNLAGINENESLQWRPSWFKQEPFSIRFWTIQNPPNVVTERIPCIDKGRQYFARRMRQAGDPPPIYIKNWDHWKDYCELYGVPNDFFSEQQINLLRLGLPRDGRGLLCGMFAIISRTVFP